MKNCDIEQHYSCSHRVLNVDVELEDLKEQWLELEKKADASFFTSWYWIGTWLKCFRPNVTLLQVRDEQDSTVGMALLVANQQYRHRVINHKSIHLSHTGDAKKDQIWAEYNGILCFEGKESEVYSAAIRHITNYMPAWQEFFSGVVDSKHLSYWRNAAHFNRLWQHVVWESKGLLVNLGGFAGIKDGYLQSLSKNTRWQIRRTEKKLRLSGNLKFITAETTSDALEILNNITLLHKQRWGKESGFENPFFYEFHRQMLKDNFVKGVVQCYSLMLDNVFLAGLYNFIYRGRVYFYLSGIESRTDNQLKIGLLIHAACIQDHANNGHLVYDFMGGDMRYKRSLATKETELAISVLQKPTVLIGLENAARWLKRKFNM